MSGSFMVRRGDEFYVGARFDRDKVTGARVKLPGVVWGSTFQALRVATKAFATSIAYCEGGRVVASELPPLPVGE